MMKKLALLTLIPMTLILQGAFVMKKGQPLEKLEGTVKETQTVAPTQTSTNTPNTNRPTGWNENINTFIHPGIYHTKEELSLVRNIINTAKYKKVKDSYLQNSEVNPAANFTCGSYNAGDTKICDNWYKDAKTAEYWALRAYTEKNTKYATKSVEAIDRWAKVFNNVSGSNRPLVASWQLYQLSRAVEILIHNDYGFNYPKDKKLRMEKYLDKIYNITQKKVNGVFENDIASSHIGGNWVSATLAAKQSYWILKHGLTSEKKKKDLALKQFKYWSSFNDSMVKSYIYMNSDGALPIIFNSQGIKKSIPKKKIYSEELWRLSDKPDCFKQDGIGGEYWRDMWHMSMGLDYIGNMFEMSYIQGYKDYYSKHQKRLVSGLEVVYASLLKKHKGNDGYYLKKTCTNTASSWNTPKITASSKRTESAHSASFYQKAKSKGWEIPLMTKYNNIYMQTAEKGNAPYNYDYIFKNN